MCGKCAGNCLTCSSTMKNDALDRKYDGLFVKNVINTVLEKFTNNLYTKEINELPFSFKYYNIKFVEAIFSQISNNVPMTNTQFVKYINELNDTHSSHLIDNDFVVNMEVPRNKNDKIVYVVAYNLRNMLFEIQFDREMYKTSEYLKLRTFLIELTKFVFIQFYRTLTKSYALLPNNFYINSVVIQDSTIFVKNVPFMESRVLDFGNAFIVLEKARL